MKVIVLCNFILTIFKLCGVCLCCRVNANFLICNVCLKVSGKGGVKRAE